MMRTGQYTGAVNHVIDTGGNPGRNTITLLDGDHGFDQALAFSQKLDKLFIDNVDFTAQV